MEIIYLGHSAFLFKHRQVRVVTDPVGKAAGFKQIKTEADVVTISHDHFDHNDLSLIEGEPMIINGPGEYEVKGVYITGIQSFHDNKQGKERGRNTLYTFDIDDLRICHLGDLGDKLTDKNLEILGGVDVLLVPVGGGFTLSPSLAMEVIKQVGPSIVIPMHFKTTEHNDKFAKLSGVEEFIKISNLEPRREKKLSLKKIDLAEETELVVLDRYGR